MEIKKIFKGSGEEHSPKFFLGIEISDFLVKTCLWQVHLDKVSIVNLGSFEAWADEDSLINGIDASLTQAIREIDTEPNQVIFGLPESWMEDDQIKPEKSPLIKKVIKSLDLKPIGLVSTTQALIHQLKEDEGIPPSAILLDVLPTKVFVNLVDQGKVIQKEEVGRSDDLAKDVEEGLVRISATKLPSRFLLVSGSDMENESQQIISYPWQEHLSFLHIPKVKTFPPEYSIKAIALSGGFEAAKAAGDISEKIITKDPEIPSSAEDLGFRMEEESAPISEDVENVIEELPSGNQDPEEIRTEDVSYDNLTPVINDPFIPEDDIVNGDPIVPPVSIQKPKFNFKIPFSKFNLPKVAGSKKIALISTIPLIIILIILPIYYYLFSSSEIIIKVKPEQISKKLQVVLANKPQDDNITIPVQFKVITEEIEDQTSTTGETTVGDKAQGKVTIYNKTFEEKILDEGDSLETETGILFTLDETVKIASKSATVEGETYGKVENISVIAGKIGTAGNISVDSRLSVANFPRTSVEAVATAEFSGGSSRTVKAVSQKDIDKLKEDLTQKILDKVNESLQVSDPDLEVVTIKEPEVSNTKFSNKLNEEASTLSLRITGKAEIITYSHNFFTENINSNLKKDYPGKKLLPENTTIKLNEIKPTDKEDVYQSTVQIDGSLVSDLDTQSLAVKIKGKTVDSAKKILETTDNFSGLTLKNWPKVPILSYLLPFNSSHIQIGIEVDK
jgi:hypothetical protein